MKVLRPARRCVDRGRCVNIDIATREAVTSHDLATLASEVLARFQSDEDSERTEHVETHSDCNLTRSAKWSAG